MRHVDDASVSVHHREHGQSDGHITEWSVVVSAFHSHPDKPGEPD